MNTQGLARHAMPLDVHLMLRRENKILLMRRCATGFASGHYALVADCQEARESVTAAVIEAREEVGINLHPSHLISQTGPSTTSKSSDPTEFLLFS